MDPILRSTLLKVAGPAVAIVACLLLTRRRGLSWSNDLGLVRPTARAWILWLAVWGGWMAAGEELIDHFGLDQAKAWPEYSGLVIALRILAIGILGPIAEELVARGVFFRLLSRTRLGIAGAILITAAGWAAAHVQYGLGTVALIMTDGIVLGSARAFGRSLWLPITMHVIANLFSIAQSLTA